MAAVMIGVDPHKGSHTAVVIGQAEVAESGDLGRQYGRRLVMPGYEAFRSRLFVCWPACSLISLARTVLSMCHRGAASRGRIRCGLPSLPGAGEGDNAAAAPFRRPWRLW